MMLSLIYVSSVAPGFDASTLGELIKQASAINAKNEITGMLAYNGMHFMQLLEGKQNRVEQTMERISEDSRHDNIAVIRKEVARPRECPDWSMRAFTTPMAGAGAAQRVFNGLPHKLENDTRILFTSFASLVKEAG